MKFLAALLLPIFAFSFSSAQSFTQKQVQQLSQKWQKEGLLSEEGGKELMRWIADGKMNISSIWEELNQDKLAKLSLLPMSKEGEGEVRSEQGLRSIDRSTLVQFFVEVEQMYEQTGRISGEIPSQYTLYFGDQDVASIEGHRALFQQINQLKGPSWVLHTPVPIYGDSDTMTLKETKEQLQWWIQFLKGHELVSELIEKEMQAWIQSDKHIPYSPSPLPPLATFFEYVRSQTSFHEKRKVYHPEQIRQLASFREMGVLTDASYQGLVKSYDSTEVKDNLEIVSHFDQAFVVDLLDIRAPFNDPQEQYRLFLQMIKDSLLPDLEIGPITYGTDPKDENYGKNVYGQQLSITLDGEKYHQVPGMIFPDQDVMITQIMFRPNQERHISFFQQYLTDQGSPYRLYLMEDKDLLKGEMGTRLGIMLLDSAQHQAFLQLPWIFMEFHPGSQYYTIPTKQELRSLIQSWQSVGVKAELSPDQIDVLIPHIRLLSGSFELQTIDILSRMGLVADLHDVFSEIKETDSIYPLQSCFSALSEISGGDFVPLEIEQELALWPRPTSYPVSPSFVVGDAKYTKTIGNAREYDAFWNEGGLVEWTNEILAARGKEGRFFCIDYLANPCYSYLYLTPQQHQYFSTHHPELFPR